MATAAQVAIDIVADSSKATAAFDDTAAAAKEMSNKVESAGGTAARSLDGIASSADDMGGKAGKATGALGALASGAELAGPGFAKYGTALQSAALATDFASGVSDTLNLVLESTILKNIKTRAVTIAKAVAEKSAAVATRTLAIAQRALNLAMAANPIGLIVVAITLLVAGLVLAYKKSETFRNIVDAVGKVGQKAFGWVVDRVKDLIKIVGDLVGWFRDRLPKAFQFLSDKVGPIVDALLAPFRLLKDIIDDILNLIGKIKLPDIGGIGDFIGGINPFGRQITTSPTSSPVVVDVSVPGGFIGSDSDLAGRLAPAIALELDRITRRVAT